MRNPSSLSFLFLLLCSLALVACGGPAQPPVSGLRGVGGPAWQGAAMKHEGLDDRDDKTQNHCVLPWGADWNVALGVESAIVIPACPTVPRGSESTPLMIYWGNGGGDPETPFLYPAGYTPTFADPNQDFLAKVKTASYVVKPDGTTRSKTFTFPARRVVTRSTIGALWKDSGYFPDAQLGWTVLAFTPELPPVGPGAYTVDLYLDLSAENCDGTTDDESYSCLPAGRSYIFSQHFTVPAAH